MCWLIQENLSNIFNKNEKLKLWKHEGTLVPLILSQTEFPSSELCLETPWPLPRQGQCRDGGLLPVVLPRGSEPTPARAGEIAGVCAGYLSVCVVTAQSPRKSAAGLVLLPPYLSLLFLPFRLVSCLSSLLVFSINKEKSLPVENNHSDLNYSDKLLYH